MKCRKCGHEYYFSRCGPCRLREEGADAERARIVLKVVGQIKLADQLATRHEAELLGSGWPEVMESEALIRLLHWLGAADAIERGDKEQDDGK